MIQDQREEIKQKIDLVEFINSYVPLKKTGRNFKALCPFHSEVTPSFIVSPERQIWKCFGCGEGGDIFGFMMKIENVEFGEAMQILAKRVGIRLRRYQPTEDEKIRSLLYEVNHLASEFYHYLLLSHPIGKRALDYILGRGISKESLRLFKLGFAPGPPTGGWDSLQKYLVGKKGYRIEDLEKAGLVIKSTKYYDRFRGRLMFPLKNHRADIVGFAGRVLDPQAKEAKYVNTPETLIYHKSHLLYGLSETKEAIKKADQAIAVEGELDLISSYQAGVKNVVAIKGSSLTVNQIQLLGRFTKNLVLAMDKDAAGDMAAKRGIEIAEAVGMMIKVIEIEGGKDPDEVAQKNPALWQALVKKAVPVYDYFIDSACLRFDPQTAEGKRRIGQELVPILAKMDDEITKSHYAKKLAEKLDVEEEAVLTQIDRTGKTVAGLAYPNRGERVALSETSQKRPPAELLEEYLLALAFQSEHWDWLLKRKITLLINTPRFVRLLGIVAEYLKQFKTFKSERLAKMLPAELKETFDRFYLVDFSDLIEDQEKVDREAKTILFRLKEFELKRKLQEISGAIKILEKKKALLPKENQQLDKLAQDFCVYSRQLTETSSKKV